MEKRVISTQVQEEDLKIEKSLRPQTLDDYIGQQKAKEKFKNIYRGGKGEGGIPRPCAVLRTARTWKDHARRNHCQ